MDERLQPIAPIAVTNAKLRCIQPPAERIILAREICQDGLGIPQSQLPIFQDRNFAERVERKILVVLVLFVHEIDLLFLVLQPSPALMATRGYAASEVETTYTRALELCDQVGDSSQRFPVQLGLLTYYALRAEYSNARELGERLLRVAQRAASA